MDEETNTYDVGRYKQYKWVGCCTHYIVSYRMYQEDVDGASFARGYERDPVE
jgi:hypothetical protein